MGDVQERIGGPTITTVLDAGRISRPGSLGMTVRIETQVDVLSHGLSRYLWLLWVVWLAFFAYPLLALFHGHPSPFRVAIVLGAAGAFAAVYTWNIVHALRQLRAGGNGYSPWLAIAVLIVVALGLTIGDRRDWVELFIFAIVSLGPSLPPRRALLAIGVFVVLAPLLGWVIGAGPIQMGQMVFQSAVSGIAVIIVGRVIVLDRELRLARGEIARLAVSEERLRFARDLHDLLGHSLSLIALKSELAGKLITVAPERAAAEMRDVENTARSSLQEVREAVAGYRQPGLQDELRSALQMLAAAGIECRCDGQFTGLLPAQEAVAAWAVREGVTNVIRHSRARHCTIRMTRDAGNVVVEVVDDGCGIVAAEKAGSGLAGLSERVAAAGGWCEFGSAPEGGFRILLTLPGSGHEGGNQLLQATGTG